MRTTDLRPGDNFEVATEEFLIGHVAFAPNRVKDDPNLSALVAHLPFASDTPAKHAEALLRIAIGSMERTISGMQDDLPKANPEEYERIDAAIVIARDALETWKCAINAFTR